MSGAPVHLTVVGEAIVDLVPDGRPDGYVAHAGGSPFNVAVGLARLGREVSLMARIGDSGFGRLLRGRAAAEGVDLRAAPAASEPPTLAVVTLDEEARASYDFYLEGTADWAWSDAELGRLPADTGVLHFGSLAAWTGPGDERILALARRVRDGGGLVSFDPNVRPALLPDTADARRRVERGIALADVVKASAEDVEWLRPGAAAEAVAADWLAAGAALVVVTDGPDGATAFTAGAPPLHRPGRTVAVVDTVGAGDAFTAGLLAALAERGLTTADGLRGAGPDALAPVIDAAVTVSALTCTRAGADPPTRAELHTAATGAGAAAR